MFWYIETSPEEALADHVQINYTDAGVLLQDADIDGPARLIPPNTVLTVDGVSRTAALWVALEDDAGLLGATVY